MEKGSAIHIHVICASLEKAQRAFEILAEEGIIVEKLQLNPPTHDNSVSGMLKDKYGFNGVLSAQLR